MHSVNNYVGKKDHILCTWAPSFTSSIEKSRGKYVPKYIRSFFCHLASMSDVPKGQSWWLLFHTWLMWCSEFCIIFQPIFVFASNFAKKFLIGIFVLTKLFPHCDLEVHHWAVTLLTTSMQTPFVLRLGGLTPQHALKWVCRCSYHCQALEFTLAKGITKTGIKGISFFEGGWWGTCLVPLVV